MDEKFTPKWNGNFRLSPPTYEKQQYYETSFLEGLRKDDLELLEPQVQSLSSSHALKENFYMSRPAEKNGPHRQNLGASHDAAISLRADAPSFYFQNQDRSMSRFNEGHLSNSFHGYLPSYKDAMGPPRVSDLQKQPKLQFDSQKFELEPFVLAPKTSFLQVESERLRQQNSYQRHIAGISSDIQDIRENNSFNLQMETRPPNEIFDEQLYLKGHQRFPIDQTRTPDIPTQVHVTQTPASQLVMIPGVGYRMIDVSSYINENANKNLPPGLGSSSNNCFRPNQEMPLESADGFIYKIQFKRMYRYFILGASAPKGIKSGDFVKVEADRGEDLGVVCGKIACKDFKEEKPTAGYRGRGFAVTQEGNKRLIRIATSEECTQLPLKEIDELKILNICRDKVLARNLPMIIRDSEFQFDRHKLTLYFEADKRIDFRDLVSDLFALYKTRIWMQQIDMSFRPDEEASKSLRTGISIPNREVSCNFYNSESETLRVSDTCTFDGDFGGFETPQNQGQLFYQNMSPNHPQSNFSVVSDTDSNMSLQSGLNKNFSSLPIIRDRINETVVSEPDTDSNLALNRDFKFDSDVGFFPSYGKHH